jgi:putative copper resistance protein D
MLGGGTLWVIGDLVGLPFLAAQLIHMMREDAAEAAVIDAELDARDAAATAAAAPAAQPAAGTPAGPDVPPPASQPWWESDPRFTRRFSSADDQ